MQVANTSHAAGRRGNTDKKTDKSGTSRLAQLLALRRLLGVVGGGGVRNCRGTEHGIRLMVVYDHTLWTCRESFGWTEAVWARRWTPIPL